MVFQTLQLQIMHLNTRIEITHDTSKKHYGIVIYIICKTKTNLTTYNRYIYTILFLTGNTQVSHILQYKTSIQFQCYILAKVFYWKKYLYIYYWQPHIHNHLTENYFIHYQTKK